MFIRELPPRTRRIRQKTPGDYCGLGTTSAYAENTAQVPTASTNIRNYLRVRGEYRDAISSIACLRELPPRTRRILPYTRQNVFDLGTTSAYAENTVGRGELCGGFWNYLRVRGEYIQTELTLGIDGELPPRTRRIPVIPLIASIIIGTTSAYAENTWCGK